MRTLLILVTLPAFTTAAPVPKVKAKDTDVIVGRWKLVEVQYDDGGKQRDADDMKWKADVYEFCSDGTYCFTKQGCEPEKKSYKLDPTASPKQFDVYDKDEKLYAVGVYELAGDTFKLCVGRAHDAPRPTVLKAEEKAATHVLVFERIKDE